MGLTLQFIIIIAGLFIPQLQTALVEFSAEGVGTFLEGQNACKHINGTLATFVNKTENDNVLSDFSSYGEHYWIGLHDNMSSWSWSLNETVYNSSPNVSFWAESEPQLSVMAKICVLMDPAGLWYDELCTETRPAVCYYGPGPAKYILVTTPMTWERAQEYCRYNYTDLVSVRNRTESNNITTLLTEASWIGLSRVGWEKWSDETPRNFTNFQSQDLALNQTSTANFTCARANSSSGLWSKVSCESNSSILCQSSPEEEPVTTTAAAAGSSGGGSSGGGTYGPAATQPPAQTTTAVPDAVPSKNTLKLRLQSNTDLNDPSVQNAILQQLHDNLDNYGLSEFKLRWIQSDGQAFHKETTKENNQDC